MGCLLFLKLFFCVHLIIYLLQWVYICIYKHFIYRYGFRTNHKKGLCVSIQKAVCWCGKGMYFGDRKSWVQTLTVLFTNSLTLGKSEQIYSSVKWGITIGSRQAMVTIRDNVFENVQHSAQYIKGPNTYYSSEVKLLRRQEKIKFFS